MPPNYSVKDFFADTWKNFLDIAGESVAASAAGMPEVQKKIEEAKTTEAKNILFKYSWLIFLGVIALVALKFKK